MALFDLNLLPIPKRVQDLFRYCNENFRSVQNVLNNHNQEIQDLKDRVDSLENE